MNKTKDYTEANRLAWNRAMPYHRKAMDDEWDQLMSDKNYIYQEEPERSILQGIGIKDKAIVHLCCNNGLELMSLKRLGAGRCAGFDISDEAVLDAKRRSRQFGIDCEFHRSSVYEIPSSFDNEFDLVYITIGALTWLPDLSAFFARVRSLLKTSGNLFIYEQHPFMQVLPYDVSQETEKPVIENNYFYDDCLVYNDSLDYYGNVEYEAPDTYEFIHTLSDILDAVIDNRLRLTKFLEYEHDISNGFGWVKKTGLRLPLSYILTAVKE